MANSLTTYAVERVTKSTNKLTWSWLSDDADGSITAKASTESIHGFITRAVWNPGSVAPTADYDTVLNDADGVDVLGGEGADRHTTTSEQAMPAMGNTYAPVRVDSVLTFSGSAAGNAKTGSFSVYAEID